MSIGNNRILKNVDLEIPNNKITCIIGSSGCGKSTLLKTINRLIDDNERVKIEGKIVIDGENIYEKQVEITHIRKKWIYCHNALLRFRCLFPTILHSDAKYTAYG
ncbi:MAG: ATP-binding cassette domain-containing protein [Candidatus Azobacteroides sp.]|nr:ATP-binding cassette domain-containing protein [Candidatus Azobacteroides sp.]